MSEIQEIEVQIDADGRVKIEVRGVTGRKCEALTRELEQMLGGVVTGRVHHDAYHQDHLEATDADRQHQES